ncbi:DUF1661 domain-containing protein [Porphyromonas gingivalis]|nr:DUF1661 domain-containing protein [Porphyromonas gingivalis]
MDSVCDRFFSCLWFPKTWFVIFFVLVRELKNLRAKTKVFTRVFFEDPVRLFPVFWFDNRPLIRSRRYISDKITLEPHKAFHPKSIKPLHLRSE